MKLLYNSRSHSLTLSNQFVDLLTVAMPTMLVLIMFLMIMIMIMDIMMMVIMMITIMIMKINVMILPMMMMIYNHFTLQQSFRNLIDVYSSIFNTFSCIQSYIIFFNLYRFLSVSCNVRENGFLELGSLFRFQLRTFLLAIFTVLPTSRIFVPLSKFDQ